MSSQETEFRKSIEMRADDLYVLRQIVEQYNMRVRPGAHKDRVLNILKAIENATITSPGSGVV